jgi:hypothetical protein
MAADAATVPCRYCGARPNDSCRNKLTGDPLRDLVAHPIRTRDAQHAQTEVPPSHPAARTLPAQGGGTSPTPDDEELF